MFEVWVNTFNCLINVPHISLPCITDKVRGIELNEFSRITYKDILMSKCLHFINI